eukprot:4606-Heterococcus_DN1.PRE.2
MVLAHRLHVLLYMGVHFYSDCETANVNNKSSVQCMRNSVHNVQIHEERPGVACSLCLIDILYISCTLVFDTAAAAAAAARAVCIAAAVKSFTEMHDASCLHNSGTTQQLLRVASGAACAEHCTTSVRMRI